MVLNETGVQALVCCAHRVLQKLFYRTSRILYRCLGFVLKLPNSVCKEIVEKRSLFTKGKVLHLHPSRSKLADHPQNGRRINGEGSPPYNRTELGPRGVSSGGEFSHLHTDF